MYIMGWRESRFTCWRVKGLRSCYFCLTCIVPLYKGKGEQSEYKNYRSISLLSMVGKIYAGILADRVCGVIEDEQGVSDQGRNV